MEDGGACMLLVYYKFYEVQFLLFLWLIDNIILCMPAELFKREDCSMMCEKRSDTLKFPLHVTCTDYTILYVHVAVV